MESHRSRKLKTRPVPITGLIAAVVMLIEAAPAQAVVCAQYRNGSTNCWFTTQSQCLEAISGVGGFCAPQGGAAPSTAEPATRHARTPAEPKRKHETKRATPAVAAVPAAAPPSAPAAPATALAAATPVAAPAVRPLPSQFIAARQLVFDGQYEAGIAALRALHDDDHPEVAAYIGLAHRGLGHVADARTWYDQALHADPNHLLTLMFDGMLRVEQGDLRVARDNLAKLGQLCGATCSEYRALEESVAAKR